jgi:hypothetical protein
MKLNRFKNASISWQLIANDLICGGKEHTVDIMRAAYGVTQHANPQFWTALAQAATVFDVTKSILYTRYALEFYKKERQWLAVVAAAHEALFYPDLIFTALSFLLDAALQSGDLFLIKQSGSMVCDYYERNLLSSPQLLNIFFTSIMPHYSKQLNMDRVLLVRTVLYQYNQSLSDLLYTQMQAYLYSYRTTVTEQLIGDADPLRTA